MGRQGNGGRGTTVEFTSKELFLEINRKLDEVRSDMVKKADRSELALLEATVADLQRHGSDNAKETEKQVAEMVRKVEELEKTTATVVAVDKNKTHLDSVARTTRYQTVSIIVSIVLGVVGLVLSVLHGAK